MRNDQFMFVLLESSPPDLSVMVGKAMFKKKEEDFEFVFYLTGMLCSHVSALHL